MLVVLFWGGWGVFFPTSGLVALPQVASMSIQGRVPSKTLEQLHELLAPGFTLQYVMSMPLAASDVQPPAIYPMLSLSLSLSVFT